MDSLQARGSGKRKDSDLLSLCPREMSIMKFVEARASEMQTMSFLISARGGNLRLMQHLPIHMRRRAMSHNARRFPRRMQVLARSDIGSQNTKLSVKRPRKFHRPREKKRWKIAHHKHGGDSDSVWLRTHIWHAKRFKMEKIWGRSMPFKTNEKCLRKVYRATDTGTLLQDISYMTLIEVIGEQEKMVNAFQRMTHSTAGDAMKEARYLSGRERGLTDLYKPDSYPLHCVGPVSFLWMPEGASSQESPLINVNPDQRKLWLWTHPACSNHVLATLEILAAEYGCRVVRVQNSLSLFRLFGGGSTSTLRDVLVSATRRDVNDVVIDEVALTLERHGGTEHHVFSVMVKYPALYRKPGGRRDIEKAQIKIETAPPSLPEHDPLSPLFWSDEARDTFNADIAEKLRGRALKTDLDLSEDLGDDATIPILLIRLPQQLGARRAAPGWEVILPSNAAMLVWKAFIFHQARPVAMFEWQHVSTELGYPVYPYSHPDSEAGRRFALEQAESCKRKYELRPPGKRPNFNALNVADPFTCPWEKLVSQWVKDTNWSQYFVLRDRSSLMKIGHAVQHGRVSGVGQSLPRALVPVRLTLIGKGALDNNSMIAFPTLEDLCEHDEFSRDPKEAVRKNSKAIPPTRPIMGYLHLAGFSLSLGRCEGQGFVSLKAVDELLERSADNRVLVRATGTPQYRLAKVQVVCEWSPVQC